MKSPIAGIWYHLCVMPPQLLGVRVRVRYGFQPIDDWGLGFGFGFGLGFGLEEVFVFDSKSENRHRAVELGLGLALG